MNTVTSWIAEMASDISRFAYRIVPNWGGLRSAWRVVSTSFFPTQPAYDKTVINYDLARQLYRNDGGDSHLGAGFCRPIIDRSVEFMGLPQVKTGEEDLDNRLNDAIRLYWSPQITEMLRNSMRDSKCVVRIYQPNFRNPLVTEEERENCKLEIIEPERCTFIRDPRDPDMYVKVVIVTKVEWPDDDTTPEPDPQRGSRPQVKEHEIWEIITPDRHTYYDKTDNKWLPEWAQDNTYGFVPMLEVWNEYDSALSGGQSDLESVYPFVKAFHEVLLDALKAHKYHSIPKLKFKVANVAQFLQNNFPNVLDENGKPIPGESITWKGREVLFIGENEDLEFIQMESVLGDSKTLLEFLIDCISIASETPEWAFMRVEGGTSQGGMNAQTEPFVKKIERKRLVFQPYIQMICKMHLAINGQTPTRPEIVWDEVRVESLVAMADAIQKIVMSFEVLLERKIVSENTSRGVLKRFRIFDMMKSPEREAADAADNVSLMEEEAEVAAKFAPPASPNGTGDKTKVPISGRTGGGANE